MGSATAPPADHPVEPEVRPLPHPGAGTEIFGARFCQAFRLSARRSLILVSLVGDQ